MNRLLWILIFPVGLATANASASTLAELIASPGEWLVTVGGAMVAHTTARACYHGSDTLGDIVASRLGNCGPRKIDLHDQSATLDAVCTISGSQVSLHSKISLTGPNSLRAENVTHIENLQSAAGPASGDFRSIVTARRIGACRAGDIP